ncbi:uncharacterized protein LOC105205391 [Solenopsis invicta]|uniref:uncharacterized protein LOC105205391 n=1 Tax=Solenopsis invicta TaxID=13686 RepID=UPI000595DA59|nr:uncharacterized protein LOC105205391 [Solenopsis invicta]
MMVGPTIQDELFCIILRLRQHKYVMSADITKMYRQIWMHESQRDLQRILWRWTPDEPLRTFRLNTITYGTSSAPFLATRCLTEIAQLHHSKHPAAAEIIRRDFYVDDLLTGKDEIGELVKLQRDIIQILKTAQFELRKWRSNAPELCTTEIDKESTVPIGEEVKTLGLPWNTTSDSLTYKACTNSSNKRITKRSMLSDIAQLYDPLGLLGPVIVQAKIMLQELWQLKLGWDESMPMQSHSSWKKWRQHIECVNHISIARQVICDKPTFIELHGFCDASEKAYGACVYICSINAKQERTIKLVCAKSRVAPLKRISMPRLELCGVLLLAQLCGKIKDAMIIPIKDTHHWSDSTITLAWIAGEPHQWHTFVANRISEIHRLTDKHKWHHVRSDQNPADLLSRGVNAEDLKGKQLWWEGPSFLQQQSGFNSHTPPDLKDIPERKGTNPCLAAMESEGPDTTLIQRFSSFTRLKRVVAYCLRFAANARLKGSRLYLKRSGVLSVQELEDSTVVIIKQVQSVEFADELRSLQSNSPVNHKSELRNLHPFLDSKGQIRVEGRLSHTQLPYSQKHPIVLPGKHHITELLVRHEHYRNLHAGQQAVLPAIRTRYWPLSGRIAIRRVLRRCIVCFRAQPVCIKQLMGDLPRHRVIQARPFLNTGLDYAKPFSVKLSRNKTSKAYVCLFVCFAVKAVHLELVNDLSTTCFLNALKRFVARRGRCINLYSDNGTNFVGANNALKEVKEILTKEATQDQIKTFLAEQSIAWHFIPAYSPHMGSLWEAAIKSAKTHMRKVIGSMTLTLEELYTVLTQIEACMNSRPLTLISQDPNDLIALTTGHFLIGEPLTAIPECEVSDVPSNRLNRYEYLIQLKQHFWKRWSQEYIAQLQPRTKWQIAKENNIRIGTMVLLKNENTPLMTWLMGRILESHPDKKGLIRVVTIRTKNGTCQRAISKICLLPVDSMPLTDA